MGQDPVTSRRSSDWWSSSGRSAFGRYPGGVLEERRAIMNAARTPMIIIRESDGLVCEVNSAATRFTGFPEDQLVARPIGSLARRVPDAPAPTTDVVPAGEGTEEFLILATASGKPRYAFGTVIALRGGDEGRILMVLRPAGDVRGAPTPTPPGDLPEVIGRSAAIRDTCRLIGRVAPTNSTVLILGESGTGKEVFARALHRHSLRASGPMVRVNCAALSEMLLESELFGHVRGAFTGAIRDRKGRFSEAHGGTILLDEIGSMSMAGQTKLLRVLQEREFEPVGSSHTERVDVRVVATTNVDLRDAAQRGQFREDLFYRLSVISLTLPPLRERREDIPLLANAFARRFGSELGRRIYGFAPEAVELLLSHSWPGNVRELENVIERAVVVAEGEMIGPASLGLEQPRRVHADEEEDAGRLGLRRKLEIIERQIVLQTLWKSNWVRKNAAEELGIDPRNLSYFLKKHGISPEDERDAKGKADDDGPEPAPLPTALDA